MGGIEIMWAVMAAVGPTIGLSQAPELIDVKCDTLTGILQVVNEMHHLAMVLKKPDRGVIAFADVPARMHRPGYIADNFAESALLAHLRHLPAEVSALKRDLERFFRGTRILAPHQIRADRLLPDHIPSLLRRGEVNVVLGGELVEVFILLLGEDHRGRILKVGLMLPPGQKDQFEFLLRQYPA